MGLKLYGWQPNGHGELSWFVVAETEEQARAAVGAEIARREALQFDDPNRISKYDSSGWNTDYYTLTVSEPGEVQSNVND